MQRKRPGLSAYVMFDCYTVRTTKYQTQKRRRLNKSSPDVILNLTSPMPRDKTKFLANRLSKQELIKLMSQGLEDAGTDVKHTDEEGDADAKIVRKALVESFTGKAAIKVLADDTYARPPPPSCNITDLYENQAT